MENSNTSPLTKPSVGNNTNTESHENQNFSIAQFEALYLAKDYTGARDYLLANKGRFDSSIYNYNLGTVYLKIEDFAKARYHLELAKKEGLINSGTLNNITYTNLKLEVDDLSTSVSYSDKAIDALTSIPKESFYSITLILILVGLILVRMGRLAKTGVIITFFVLCLIPMCLSKFYVEELTEAIALESLTLYEGPSKIFSEKGTLRAGSKVILSEEKENWYFIKYPISLTGWIEKKDLGLFEN